MKDPSPSENAFVSFMVLAASCVPGAVGFGLLFSDAPGPVLSKVLATVVASGGAFSLASVQPRRWLVIAVLSSWGAVAWGIAGILMLQPELVYLVLVLPLALAAGYAGSRLGLAKGIHTHLE